jgi:tellurite resistance protein TerC
MPLRTLLSLRDWAPKGSQSAPGPGEDVSLWEVMSRSNKVVGYEESYAREAVELSKAEGGGFSLQWCIFLVLLVAALFVDYKYGGNAEEEDSTKVESGSESKRKARKRRNRGFKKAMLWTAAWVLLAQVFAFGVLVTKGYQQFLLFQASYLLEKALSLDNVFVFLMLFKSMHTPPSLQPNILNWGILLALVFRAAFIVAGTVLLQLFAWMMPLLGLFLIYTGYTTWGEEEEEEGEGEGAEDDNARSEAFARAAEESFVVRQLSKVLPLITRYDPQGRLLVKQALVAKGEGLLGGGGGGGGAGAPRWHATPQLIVLVAIAASDVVFAMDSIPAILSITTDPFLVITSNCFAVMGLRSLFFVLAALQSMFKYLQQALAVILAAVGAKMVLGYFEVHCSILGFLVFMVGVLVLAMVASIAAVKEEKKVEKMMRQPQMLPASFNPRAATHVVRPQPMQVRGRKIPDWVAAQRQQAAGLS